MQSYFEINVSHNGKHLFATAPRSASDAFKAKKIYDEIKARFPESEGYETNCTYWECEGRQIEF